MHKYLHFRPVQIITGHVIYNSQYKICIDQVKVALVIMQENMKPSGPLGHTNAVEFTKKCHFWQVVTQTISRDLEDINAKVKTASYNLRAVRVNLIKIKVKGQLISECPFNVLNFSKNQRQNLTSFCPRIYKVVKSTK